MDFPQLYVCDFFIDLIDVSAANGFDLYTSLLANSGDYATMISIYGLIKYKTVMVKYMPFLRYSSLATDYAIGAVVLRQGVFDTSPTPIVSDILEVPGAILATNKDPFSLSLPIKSDWIPVNMTNTQDSIVPKINFLYSWDKVATTNTNHGLLHIQTVFECKARIE
jgi:hypothetical protein